MSRATLRTHNKLTNLKREVDTRELTAAANEDAASKRFVVAGEFDCASKDEEVWGRVGV